MCQVLIVYNMLNKSYWSLKSQPLNTFSPMKSSKCHKKCSRVEISNLNNFCSIHCRALKFVTHEELERIRRTNFQFQHKSKVCFIPCWVCFSALTHDYNVMSQALIFESTAWLSDEYPHQYREFSKMFCCILLKTWW